MESHDGVRREIDERIGFRMDNHAPRGTKLRAVQVIDSPTYPNVDKLNLGDIVTVECTDERDWSTVVYLQEFPGLRFNSVCFAEEDECRVYLEHQPIQCPRCKSSALMIEDNNSRVVFKQDTQGQWDQVKNALFGEAHYEYECEQCGHVWPSETAPTAFFRYRTIFIKESPNVPKDV